MEKNLVSPLVKLEPCKINAKIALAVHYVNKEYNVRVPHAKLFALVFQKKLSNLGFCINTLKIMISHSYAFNPEFPAFAYPFLKLDFFNKYFQLFKEILEFKLSNQMQNSISRLGFVAQQA